MNREFQKQIIIGLKTFLEREQFGMEGLCEKAKVNRFDMCVNSISWGGSPQKIRYILTSLPNHDLKKSFVADCSP